MAFIGIFFIIIFLFILFVSLFGFVFIPCLIISIINLVQGIKHRWPKKNIIPLAITGSIVLLFVIAFLAVLVLYIKSGSPSINYNDYTSESANIMNCLLFYL